VRKGYLKLALVFLVSGLAVSAQANLLTNDGFETGDFTGWWTWTADPENQSVSIDTDYVYEGTYSAELWSASAEWSAQMGQGFEFGGDQGWTLSFAYRAITPSDWGSAGIAIDYYDADWNWLDYEWIELFNEGSAPNPGEWVLVENPFITPTGTAHVELKFEVANWATVNFDNISAMPEADDRVDFTDYAWFASAWLTTLGQPYFDENYDFDNDNDVDAADLALFVQDWLLKPADFYTPPQTSRKKLSFNTGWKFYKGNAGAAFEHVAMDEVGTVQGENNWYFAASTANTGARDGLMTLRGTTWKYSNSSGTCYIYDGRSDLSSNPHPYSIELSCSGGSGGPIPRLEWVSPYPNNTTVTITGTFMLSCSIDGQKVRILHNGVKIWESPAVNGWYYKPDKSTFSVEIADLDNGDIITFMPSAYVAGLRFRWMHITIFESGTDPDTAAQSVFDDSSWQMINLPHNPVMDRLWPDWPTYSYEGPAWYRKHFNLDPNYIGKKLFVEFEAGSTVTDVWFNDTHLTTHYGGYLPFIVDITDYAEMVGRGGWLLRWFIR